MSKSRKQIAFDLDTANLKKYCPKEHWQSAYADIKRFMTQNNFIWQQGSVYTSEKGLTPYETYAVIKAMIQSYPWTNVCMRDCVVTNIGRSHNQNYLFDKNADIQPREKSAEADERPRQLYISR